MQPLTPPTIFTIARHHTPERVAFIPTFIKLKTPQGIMLCVFEFARTQPPRRPSCRRNTPLKHHALNAHRIRRARLVRSASLAPCALRFRILISLSTATFAQIQKVHATARLRSFHLSKRFTLRHFYAALRHPSLQTGHALAHCCNSRSISFVNALDGIKQPNPRYTQADFPNRKY